VLAYCRELPRSAAILELAYGNQVHAVALQRLAPTWSWHVATPHAILADAAKRHNIPVIAATAPRLLESRRFDAVLLLQALEHCQDPVTELECARACLRPGGSIMVLSPNLDSAAGQRFRGRHWAGYDFPRHRVLFGPASLRALARRAGLTVDRLRSVRYSPAWTHSAALLLSDWSAPLAVRGRNGRGGVLGSSLAAAAEVAAAWSDRGAWLEAVLRAPEAEAA
jgi:SAM-dependent methyltransferase